MSALVLEPTSTAQWHALVCEAETASRTRLDEELESHLVFLLMRFLGRADLANSVLGLAYLQSFTEVGRVREEKLREVGDQCLLYSGFFPKQAQRKRVQISYFVDLGRSAYTHLAQVRVDAIAELYQHLADDFIRMMDVLAAIRKLDAQWPRLEPLEAFPLWEATGSAQALDDLRAVTASTPIASRSRIRH